MMTYRIVAAALCIVTLLAAPALAQSGDVDKGELIYQERCLQCHGDEGDGLGPAAERLNPPPRDFTLGLYKFITSAFDADLPNDTDIIRMIRDGMPGTAMPGWGDLLPEQDILDVLAYIKVFAELEGEPEGQTDFGTQVQSSPESIAAGDKLFHESERCSECHGVDGKGDAVKKLKNDNGERTWPRNLTKPWTYRASSDAKDIFARISTGIPTTQMPSFADPKSKKSLSIEERWHVANYVVSLAKTDRVVRPENTVIQAARVDGFLPGSPDDAAWTAAPPSTFFMVPQIVGQERFFTSANDTVSVRALYNDTKISLHLEWDDRTKSIPGDDKAKAIADEELSEDAIAVQLPMAIPTGMEKPYFLMGDTAKPVNLWRWSSGTTDNPASITLLDATGIDAQEARDANGLTAKADYKDGTWRVVMTRALTTDQADKDLQFQEGRFIPIAFFAWDGSNSEAGSRHAMTTWYWLLLKPSTGARPIIGAIIAFFLICGLLFWWNRSAGRSAS
ncbi:MAG: c-type cytochrome [Rhodospirillaceae bacterium]|jgi:DMSO reductase family type II enzyme heme b subunit|nr:c-type cytochrome [Rhodospirillaceae bacterium]MBT4488634.1 c-type cytochrome [Rhodospirillaceae bacterium]MBT5192039.1 c-type cytochrome [Rhodospirillaceae bacterium]MBT5897870.1 c-type cytochrome [Rhodospirillaceae bacterium]MBT6431350.1 c-type cytochrome [Rhodospirillaceae bacterium]